MPEKIEQELLLYNLFTGHNSQDFNVNTWHKLLATKAH